uniref:Uncharacterized protein n=1 Tax=Leptobrachium leishanense TaxID=445787 RepID=A0A8C5Q052_9ANUR
MSRSQTNVHKLANSKPLRTMSRKTSDASSLNPLSSFWKNDQQIKYEPKPEDCIPDLPGNESARDFLAHATTRGLWMPLGKEVKVMQCWRRKQYGHTTGDRERPYFIKGNQKIERFRVAHEDPRRKWSAAINLLFHTVQKLRTFEKDMKSHFVRQGAGHRKCGPSDISSLTQNATRTWCTLRVSLAVLRSCLTCVRLPHFVCGSLCS